MKTLLIFNTGKQKARIKVYLIMHHLGNGDAYKWHYLNIAKVDHSIQYNGNVFYHRTVTTL